MPVNVINNGANKIDIDRDFLENSDGTITIHGDGSHVLIGQGANSFERMSLICGPSSTVHIGHGVRLASVQIYACPNAKILIGPHSSFVNEGQVFAHEAKPITIGHNCLISENVSFWSSDVHSIIDRKTGQRINHARPINVGHRVWLGRGVSILKGADIGDDAVIGANSLVTGAIPANTLAIGSPARVVRENVTWDIDIVPEGDADRASETVGSGEVAPSGIHDGDGGDAGAVHREIVIAQDAIKRALDLLPNPGSAVEEERFRVEAVQTVLAAVLASQTWRGLDRRKFRRLIAEASRSIPDTGPSAVQHEVLLTEARKVLAS